MEKRNKRRVAHLEEHSSKRKRDDDDDVVANIVKQMDANRNQKLNELLKTRAAEKVLSRSNSSSTPLIPNQQKMTSFQKKILRSQRHPLMEKVQKNINFIKHNRRMPKPRAHVGGFRQTNEKRETTNDSIQCSSSVLKNTRSTNVGKNRPNPSDCKGYTDSDDESSDASSKSKELPNLSSDPESEYEYFIRSQKQDVIEEKTDKRSKGKKKVRSKKNELKKIVVGFKKKNDQGNGLNLQESESSDDETNKKTTKHESSKISSKITNANRLVLPPTSDESSSASSSQDELIKTKESLLPAIEKGNNVEETEKQEADEGKMDKKYKGKKCRSKKDKLIKCNQGNRLQELESSDDESINRRITERETSKIFSKMFNANRLILPPTSDESSAASCNENELLKTVESFMSSVEKENSNEVSKQLNTNLNCIVRIERNPSLEETVSQLKEIELLRKDEENLDDECLPKLQNQELKGVEDCNDEITLDSDDECMIVHEVPKSSTANTCVTQISDSASDIQILEVKSLRECEKEDENASSGINFEKLKEAIEIARMQESSSNSLHPKLLHSETYTTDNIYSVNHNDMKKRNLLPIPAEIIETVNKIDLNQILSISGNQSKENCSSITDVNVINSFPCSSSFVDNQPSITRLPSRKTENIPESHWENLKKSLAAIEFLEGHSRNLNNNSELNISTLKEILSSAERLGGQREDNALEDRGFDTHQLRTKRNENPYDELDVLTSSGIQELCHYQTSHNLLKLLNLFSRSSHEYIGKNNHENLTPGLRMLQEIELNKKRQTEVVFEHYVKHDPCFYSTIVEQVGRIKRSSKTENEGNNVSAQIKKCVNCGSKASIQCTRCMKVFFCTETCGISYWENKHYKECSGLHNEEETETIQINDVP